MNKTAQRVIKRSAPLYKGMCLSLTHANVQLGTYCKGKRRDGQVGLTSISKGFETSNYRPLTPFFYLGGDFVSP